MPKGDKKRKKEVMEKVAGLEVELDARHKQELQDFEEGQDHQVGRCEMLLMCTINAGVKSGNSSDGSVLGLLDCVMQQHGFDPPLSVW